MNAKTEQSSTHTPGPWLAASHPSSIVGWPVVAQTGRLICSIATPPKNIERVGKAKEEYDAFMAECGANARLIAAAPELADCVHDLLYLHEAHHNHPLHVAARALLAKAEGRS